MSIAPILMRLIDRLPPMNATAAVRHVLATLKWTGPNPPPETDSVALCDVFDRARRYIEQNTEEAS